MTRATATVAAGNGPDAYALRDWLHEADGLRGEAAIHPPSTRLRRPPGRSSIPTSVLTSTEATEMGRYVAGEPHTAFIDALLAAICAGGGGGGRGRRACPAQRKAVGRIAAAPSSAPVVPFTPVGNAVFSDDFSGPTLDPQKWLAPEASGIVGQSGGHLRFVVPPGAEIDTSLEPVTLTRAFEQMTFDVTIPQYAKAGPGGAALILNPRSDRSQWLAFGPSPEGRTIYPLICAKAKCTNGVYEGLRGAGGLCGRQGRQGRAQRGGTGVAGPRQRSPAVLRARHDGYREQRGDQRD